MSNIYTFKFKDIFNAISFKDQSIFLQYKKTYCKKECLIIQKKDPLIEVPIIYLKVLCLCPFGGKEKIICDREIIKEKPKNKIICIWNKCNHDAEEIINQTNNGVGNRYCHKINHKFH